MSIISSLQKVIETKNEVLFESKDGTNIHIVPEDAYSLISIHDSLCLENQRKMRGLMEDSGESFFNVLPFCYEQLTEKDS